MATKPTDDFSWAGTADPGDVDDPSASRSGGWQYLQPVPHDGFNWIQRMIGRWFAFFDAMFSSAGALTLDSPNTSLEITADSGLASTWTFGGGGIISVEASAFAGDVVSAPQWVIGTNGLADLVTDDPALSRLAFSNSGGGVLFVQLDVLDMQSFITFSETGGGSPVDVIRFSEVDSKILVQSNTNHNLLSFDDGVNPSVVQADAFKIDGASVPADLSALEVLTQNNTIRAGAVIEAVVNGSGTITTSDLSLIEGYNIDGASLTVDGDDLLLQFDDAMGTNDRPFYFKAYRTDGFADESYDSDLAEFSAGGAPVTDGNTFGIVPLFRTRSVATLAPVLTRTGMTPGNTIRFHLLVY